MKATFSNITAGLVPLERATCSRGGGVREELVDFLGLDGFELEAFAIDVRARRAGLADLAFFASAGARVAEDLRRGLPCLFHRGEEVRQCRQTRFATSR